MIEMTNVRIVDKNGWIEVYINGEKFFENNEMTLSGLQELLEEIGCEVDYIESYDDSEEDEENISSEYDEDK